MKFCGSTQYFSVLGMHSHNITNLYPLSTAAGYFQFQYFSASIPQPVLFFLHFEVRNYTILLINMSPLSISLLETL